MFCFKCGSKIADNSSFCSICGTQVSTPQSQPNTSTVSNLNNVNMDNVYSQSVYNDNVYSESVYTDNDNVYDEDDIYDESVEQDEADEDTVDRNITINQFYNIYYPKSAKVEIRIIYIFVFFILGMYLSMNISFANLGFSNGLYIPIFCGAIIAAIFAFIKKNLPSCFVLLGFSVFSLIVGLVTNIKISGISVNGVTIILTIRAAIPIIRLNKEYKSFKNGQDYIIPEENKHMKYN